MAKRLIRYIVFFLLLVSLAVPANSQMIVIPEVQAGGVILKQQLWSVMINNLSGQTRKAILSISITDRASSQPLLEAHSGVLLLQNGVKRVMYNDLAPVSYSISSAGFGMERQLNQPLPVGEYMVCYKLTDTERKNELLATECVKVIAEPLSPPQLIQPAHESMVMDARPVLTWTPPAPVYMFSSLSYDIVVSPLYKDQSPNEALQRNIPVMTTMSSNNSIMYPSTFSNLQPGKTYAWQVIAKDAARFGGKSEVWTFTVVPDSVKKIIENAPYVKLQDLRSEIFYLQQGVLKIDYVNHAGDSIAHAKIEDMTDLKARPLKVDLKLNPGQNLIQKDINRLGRLEAGHIYKLTIVNSKKETAYFRFSAKYYF